MGIDSKFPEMRTGESRKGRDGALVVLGEVRCSEEDRTCAGGDDKISFALGG
jgi:hypothetical protein